MNKNDENVNLIMKYIAPITREKAVIINETIQQIGVPRTRLNSILKCWKRGYGVLNAQERRNLRRKKNEVYNGTI